MSRENVEVVKNIQPAGVDLTELFADEASAETPFGADVDPDIFVSDFEVRFISQLREGPEVEYRGVDGLFKGWRDWLAPWSSYRLRVEDILDAGDEVVVLAQVNGRTARDGVEIEHPAAAVWTFEDGRIVRLRFYLDQGDALRAAGITPQGTRDKFPP